MEILEIHGPSDQVIQNKCKTVEFFTRGLSDAFLSDYMTDLKLHSTK